MGTLTPIVVECDHRQQFLSLGVNRHFCGVDTSDTSTRQQTIWVLTISRTKHRLKENLEMTGDKLTRWRKSIKARKPNNEVKIYSNLAR